MKATRNWPEPAVNGRDIVRRLRWVMLAVILFDIAITLYSQPASYWTDPSTVEEGNRLFHLIMAKGYKVSLLVDVFYVGGSFLLVSILPWRLALLLLLSLVLGHFFGASTWLCFYYQLGAKAMVLYGVLVSAVLVFVGFPLKKPKAESGSG